MSIWMLTNPIWWIFSNTNFFYVFSRIHVTKQTSSKSRVALSSPKKMPSAMGMGGFEGLDEEQEENADLDELELLSDAVMAFESVAFETKKKVNALDRLTFKS